jgi:hypothetical protein
MMRRRRCEQDGKIKQTGRIQATAGVQSKAITSRSPIVAIVFYSIGGLARKPVGDDGTWKNEAGNYFRIAPVQTIAATNHILWQFCIPLPAGSTMSNANR